MAFLRRNPAEPDAERFGDFEILGNLGSLEVGLATTADAVAAAQRLRFSVFYQEMSAVADADARASGRDRDRFDAVCDHLVVVDRSVAGDDGEPVVVATSRLLRQEVADRTLGFYSAGEFDLSGMRARNPDRKFLELGRSCVLAPYRTRRTAELMWHGIWRYFRENELDVMIGCGSLEGIDIDALAPLLALLRRHAPAPEAWRVTAEGGDGISLDALGDPGPLGERALLRALPPLIKGYLRLGAYVCEEAVVDRAFGTTDVFLVLPLEAISARYIRYYGAGADRYAA
jgi:putative hemolysin